MQTKTEEQPKESTQKKNQTRFEELYIAKE